MIFDKIINFYTTNKPFVIYRKPNENNVSGFFMNDDSLTFTDNFTESGFVFAPFNVDEKAILFPSENAEFMEEEFPNFDEVVLGVNARNIPAQRLYQKAGFTDTGRRIMRTKGEQYVMSLSTKKPK